MHSKFQEYKARLQFWWARKVLKDGRDFELSVDENGLIVTIISGKYSGIKFRYANMTMHTDGLLDFSTVVVYNPKKEDVTLPDFVELTTKIIRIIFADMVEKEPVLNYRKEQAKVIDENRDIDFSQPLEERDIHEEISPILEKRVSKRKPRKKTVSTDTAVYSEVQHPAVKKRTGNRNSRKKRPDGK